MTMSDIRKAARGSRLVGAFAASFLGAAMVAGSPAEQRFHRNSSLSKTESGTSFSSNTPVTAQLSNSSELNKFVKGDVYFVVVARTRFV